MKISTSKLDDASNLSSERPIRLARNGKQEKGAFGLPESGKEGEIEAELPVAAATIQHPFGVGQDGGADESMQERSRQLRPKKGTRSLPLFSLLSTSSSQERSGTRTLEFSQKAKELGVLCQLGLIREGGRRRVGASKKWQRLVLSRGDWCATWVPSTRTRRHSRD